MVARNTNVPFKGRIQKRKTYHLQIITFRLQRAAGPYSCVITGREQMQQTMYANAPLFDHLIGANEGHWGNGDANCSCSPEVQDQFELSRLLDRQVGGLCSFCDTSHIVCSASEHRGEV
jgi:hypothetical protein